MEKLLTVAAVAALMTGCANLPEPDAQVRLSSLRGAVETPTTLPFVDAAVTGTGCVLSTVGDLPKNMSMVMIKDECRVEIQAEPGEPFIHTHNEEFDNGDQ